MSVSLFIQQAMHMRRVILSSVNSQAVPHFSTLSLKRHDFRRKDIENRIYVVICSKNS